MGGGGRADSTDRDDGGLIGGQFCWVAVRPSGGRLAAAVEAAGDPVSGLVPAGFLPEQDSTDPWTQVIHTVIAARRIQGWLVYVQLTLLDRWAAAWRARPPGVEHDQRGRPVRERRPRADRPGESRDHPDRAAVRRTVRPGVGRLIRNCRCRWSSPWSGPNSAWPAGCPGQCPSSTSRPPTPCSPRTGSPVWPGCCRPAVDWPKVQTFVHATTGLDLVVAHAVERMVLGDTPDEASMSMSTCWSTRARPGLGLPRSRG